MNYVPDNLVNPGCALASEVMDNIESELEKDGIFAVFVCSLTDKYAKRFVAEECHAEFFDDIANNFKLFAKCIRQESN